MMISGFLAGLNGIDAENSLRALTPMGSTIFQVVIYFGAIFLVTLGVFAWAIISRRQRRRRHSSHHHSKTAPGAQRPSVSLRRYRTLAETGGLPPIRTAQQPPSPD